jgi:hypothetical protein
VNKDYEIERLQYALAYLASCTAATVEGMFGRKTTPKSELVRHHRILTTLQEALEGKDVSRGRGSAAIIGAERRIASVLAEIEERVA